MVVPAPLQRTPQAPRSVDDLNNKETSGVGHLRFFAGLYSHSCSTASNQPSEMKSSDLIAYDECAFRLAELTNEPMFLGATKHAV